MPEPKFSKQIILEVLELGRANVWLWISPRVRPFVLAYFFKYNSLLLQRPWLILFWQFGRQAPYTSGFLANLNSCFNILQFLLINEAQNEVCRRAFI